MEYKINGSEYRFLCILWELEPVSSTELVKQCLARLGWKKSTTYTVIKNLENKHVVRNDNAIVTSLAERDRIVTRESEAFIERMFGGSLPDFLVAFLKDRRLTGKEAEKIKKLIEEASEDE